MAGTRNGTAAVEKPERVIMLVAGESGAGKSFFVANLKNALIFDTDIGGGLSYADARIRRNGSERIEVVSYLEVLSEIRERRSQLANITTLVIDHLTTLHQEAAQRHNPDAAADFGRSNDKAAREWRKIRELARNGDFNLVCTAHLKAKYVNDKPVGFTCDASKNIDGDMMIVLHLRKGSHPTTAEVVKWRRDPEDVRGKIPPTFRFTMDEFIKLHGWELNGAREEIPVATPEQVQELGGLLSVVKLAEGTTESWLKKAKVESWDEMSSGTILKCIKHLKDMIARAGTQAPEGF